MALGVLYTILSQIARGNFYSLYYYAEQQKIPPHRNKSSLPIV